MHRLVAIALVTTGLIAGVFRPAGASGPVIPLTFHTRAALAGGLAIGVDTATLAPSASPARDFLGDDRAPTIVTDGFSLR